MRVQDILWPTAENIEFLNMEYFKPAGKAQNRNL